MTIWDSITVPIFLLYSMKIFIILEICTQVLVNLPEDFGKQIEEYFDATYKNNINKIASLKHKYDLEADRIAASLQELVDSPNNFLKTALLEKALTTLKTKIESNKKKLSDKVSTPNNTVSLVPVLSGYPAFIYTTGGIYGFKSS